MVRGRNRPCRWLKAIRCWRCFSVLILTVDRLYFTVSMLGVTVQGQVGRGRLFRKAGQDLVVELGEIFVARR